MGWVKALHLFAMILWVSGVLILTRVLAVHVQETVDVQRRLAWLEGRLYWATAFSGMLLTWVFGLVLLARNPAVLDAGVYGPAFHVKLALVVLLSGATGAMRKRMRKLAADPGTHHAPGPFKALHIVSALSVLGILLALYGFGPW